MRTESEWIQLLKDKKAECYIKPRKGKYVHDSGFGVFEVGYLILDHETNKVKEKRCIGKYSDHFFNLYTQNVDTLGVREFNMDLTLDGYIRLWSTDPTWWGGFYALSSINLRYLN